MVSNAVTVSLVILLCCIWQVGAWSGHYVSVQRSRSHYSSHCSCHSWWWGCCGHSTQRHTTYYNENQCQTGWTHNGNQNCNIPICRPRCQNDGRCTDQPNHCTCTGLYTGEYTGCTKQITCSHTLPCYPGNCHDSHQCACDEGFKSLTRADGCLSFDETVKDMHPIVGKSTANISMVRRLDGRQNFVFSIDGTDTSEGKPRVYWLNQKRINTLEFESESIFTPNTLAQGPVYVHDSKFGIVHNEVLVNVSKLPRHGGLIRDVEVSSTHDCKNGASDLTPHTGVSRCHIKVDFTTILEHGDQMRFTYRTRNGGFRKLYNGPTPYSTDYFKGLTDTKEVEYRFDFIAPKHCSEPNPFNTCPPKASLLMVEQEFTKVAIRPRWSGWADDQSGSGISQYYLEVFLLSPDPYHRLVEMSPLGPVFSQTINATQGFATYPEHIPSVPGMYSVLLEVRDLANNSRTARRLVLYDDQSEIALLDAHALYVSSALEETGNIWQAAIAGGYTTIIVDWWNHFVNELHDEKKLLNQVLDYPMQFKDLEDDGLLFAKKYVNHTLDDHEGERTVSAINNINGIVKFELGKVYSDDTSEPAVWTDVDPLATNKTFAEKINEGTKMRVWIRAHDVMGHTKVDSTLVHFDSSPPKISDLGSPRTKRLLNVDSDRYVSRIEFDAWDKESGVHKIDYKITVHVPDKGSKVQYENSTVGNMLKNPSADATCITVLGTCFLREQALNISNCWFMTGKTDLDIASATIDITVYNQAMMSRSLQFKVITVDHVIQLEGLQTYSALTNVRAEKTTDQGFRIVWDSPEKDSCYGRADIIVIISKKDGTGPDVTHYIQSMAKYFDVFALDPETSYEVQFGRKLQDDSLLDEYKLAVTTLASDAGVRGGIVAAVIAAILVLVALLIVFGVVMLRRGHMPVIRRGLRAASAHYRLTFYGEQGRPRNIPPTARPTARPFEQRNVRNVGQIVSSANTYESFNNDQSVTSSADEEIYIYGMMDFDSNLAWHVPRHDVTFDSMIKSGHFANVYKSTLKGHDGFVVAKTLKEGYTENDKLLMMAKINFTCSMVGQHPNILQFVGAVKGEVGMGPFILYEYCEHGPLNEYLHSQKASVTLPLKEKLYQYGMDIAGGMEYLASKGVRNYWLFKTDQTAVPQTIQFWKIVHRRLAARNILVTSEYDVKIAGFGPQPTDDGTTDGGTESGKLERIPVKWSAPECMGSTKDATERSDIWSYGVVLWEIFSLGDTPYSNIRGRDIAAKVRKGERLGKPDLCDDAWYGVMLKCWNLTPQNRPVFLEIRGEIDEVFTAASGDGSYYYTKR